MDFNNLTGLQKANAGVWIDLKNPFTDELLGARVKIAGIFSDAYYKAKDEIQKMMLLESDAERQLGEYEYILVAGCVLDFENVEEKGKKVEAKDAKDFLKRHRWVFDQINLEIANKKNFLK